MFVPSLRLKLNLKKIAGGVVKKEEPKISYVTSAGFCTDEKRRKKNVGDGESSAKGAWDYKQFGADWAAQYPECASDHQSPINFVEPVSDYG